MEKPQIPNEEFDQELKGQEMKPMELLPELEMLTAEVIEVKYEYQFFQGKQVFVLDENQKLVIDKNGNKIPKKEFIIKFAFKDYILSNGKPRNQWLRVGASWNDKSKLKKLMKTLGFEFELITPKVIIDALMHCVVKFQLINKDSNGKTYQNINFDSIRLVSKPESIDWS